MTLAIGFGAKRAAPSSAPASRSARLRGQVGQVRRRLEGLRRLARRRAGARRLRPGAAALYDQSLMILAASEDKKFRGASIAAPNMPWEWGVTLDDKPVSGPYHLVWPRDFYHVATAQKAAGDDEAATRLLDYLWKVQKADGSWWQNTRVNGEEYWTTLQLDETALPIVLAWWLGRTSAADWAHVEKAADFVRRRRPATRAGALGEPERLVAEHDRDRDRRPGHRGRHRAQERRRGEGGGLRGHGGRLAGQGRVLDRHDNGPYSPEPYYLRVTKDGEARTWARPTTSATTAPAGRPARDRRQLVPRADAVRRQAVGRPDDPQLARRRRGRLPRVTRRAGGSGTASRSTATARGRRRRLGRSSTTRRETHGRLWPLLTGERGEYELIAGRDAPPHLQTIANTANDGLMLPEQVWDDAPPSERRRGTRSATPLAWTHAQFIRLAWSIDAGEPIERPAIVACRYTGSSERRWLNDDGSLS